jgi:hypothetical protein
MPVLYYCLDCDTAWTASEGRYCPVCKQEGAEEHGAE